MSKTKKLVLSAMFIAIGLVLPFLTGQLSQLGSMFLPMHLPILFCGLICGWQYGITVGFITPLLRSSLFSMPVMYPQAISMAFELATYGFVIGIIYKSLKRKNTIGVYMSLIPAMLAGRIVSGVTQFILLSLKGIFILSAFLTNAFIHAIPGIIIQLILVPSVMAAVNKINNPKSYMGR